MYAVVEMSMVLIKTRMRFAGKDYSRKIIRLEVPGMLPDFFTRAMEEQLGEDHRDLRLPPPVFETLPCEFTSYDCEKTILTARFPVQERYLNPYGTVQGGILAAFVDNVIGPLSMLAAPPNVTRRFEMKYSKPVTTDMEWVEVKAWLVSCEGRLLEFSAEVRDPESGLAARAKAQHWLLKE